MYYRYQPYPYYNRYYNMDPYYYRRYYSPYYNYQRNIIDSQISDVNQSIVNYGDMIDVIQNSDVYQSMASAPDTEEQEITEETTEVSFEPMVEWKDLPKQLPPGEPL